MDLDLIENTQLKNLDMSFNLLGSLQPQFIMNLKALKSNRSLAINLVGNPFQCDCEAIPFLEFIKIAPYHNIQFEHLDQYYCLYNNQSVRITDVDVASLQNNCKQVNYYAVIIGTSVTAVIIVIVSAVVTYRCRWKIAWKVYEMRRFVRQTRHRKSLHLPVHQ